MRAAFSFAALLLISSGYVSGFGVNNVNNLPTPQLASTIQKGKTTELQPDPVHNVTDIPNVEGVTKDIEININGGTDLTDIPEGTTVETTADNDTTTDAPTTSTTSSTTSSTTTTVTPPTIPSTSTAKPTTTEEPHTTTAAPAKERHFDGASFLGGIILAVGLMAIGLVVLKFYKARAERNYHTL